MNQLTAIRNGLEMAKKTHLENNLQQGIQSRIFLFPIIIPSSLIFLFSLFSNHEFLAFLICLLTDFVFPILNAL